MAFFHCVASYPTAPFPLSLSSPAANMKAYCAVTKRVFCPENNNSNTNTHTHNKRKQYDRAHIVCSPRNNNEINICVPHASNRILYEYFCWAAVCAHTLCECVRCVNVLLWNHVEFAVSVFVLIFVLRSVDVGRN